MPTQKKLATVEELRQRIARSTIAISLTYQGLTVGQIQQLRRRLREKDNDARPSQR